MPLCRVIHIQRKINAKRMRKKAHTHTHTHSQMLTGWQIVKENTQKRCKYLHTCMAQVECSNARSTIYDKSLALSNMSEGEINNLKAIFRIVHGLWPIIRLFCSLHCCLALMKSKSLRSEFSHCKDCGFFLRC